MKRSRLKAKMSPGVSVKTRFRYAAAAGVFAIAVFSVAFVYFNLGDVFNSKASGITYYARTNGNWSDPSTWSTSCGGPASASIPNQFDNVIIGCNSTGFSVTVDGNFLCNNLTLGNGSTANMTLSVASSAYTLTINGEFRMNTGNSNNTYTLDAGSGQVAILGNFAHWGTGGTNTIRTSTGAITFGSAVTINSDRQNITISDAGTVNFNSSFTDNFNRLSTTTGSTVNFGGSYTVNSTNASWNSGSIANFRGTNSIITPNAGISFGNVQVAANGTARLNSGTGAVNIWGNLTLSNGANFNQSHALFINGNTTLGSSSTYALNQTLTTKGNWANNGGTLNGGSQTVVFNGNGKTIGGTSATAFPNLHLGLNAGSIAVSYTLNRSISCTSLTFSSDSRTRRITHGTSNPTLTVNGAVTIEQPTGNAINGWYINGGSGVINGNLIFTGTNTQQKRRGLVAVTSGSFNVSGTVTWMANSSINTETISVTTGTLTFGSALAMPRGSGTLRVSSTGTVNFNGAAPSFSLNAAGNGNTNAIFSTVGGCTVNFRSGFTNSNAAVTLANNSIAQFTGVSTVTPSALITFGNVVINSTVTLAGNIALTNDWTNNGTLNPGTSTVAFSGPWGSTQTISRNGGETFYGLTANVAGSIIHLANNITVTNSLNMGGHDFDLNQNTLTLGNNAGASLSRSSGILYNGNFRRWWPTTAISSSAGSVYGLFPIGMPGAYRPVAVNSTANPTTAGYVTAWHTDEIPITEVNYVDNEGHLIERISDRKSSLSLSGLAGGTYNIDVSFSGFVNIGVLSDLKLVTYTNRIMGSAGTSLATLGTLVAPTVRRTGISAAQLANDFVVGTRSRINTPIRQVFYSRKTGNWTDNTSTGTWSFTSGGPACSCLPTTNGLIIVDPGHTVTVNTNAAIDYMKVMNNGSITGGSTLSIGYDVLTVGSGRIAPTAAWTIGNDLILAGSGQSSANALTVNNNLNIATGTSLTITGGAALNVAGNTTINGILNIGSGTTTLSGAAATIGGTGSISGTGTLLISSDKSTAYGANLTIGANTSIGSGVTVTNNGIVTSTGNISGVSSNSTWLNNAGSRLNISGLLLPTGTLNTSAIPNVVNYNGAGNQTIKVPATSYNQLYCSTSGTKSMNGNVTVDELVLIRNSAVLDQLTFTLGGEADLEMLNTSELRLRKSNNAIVPELLGNFDLFGGTISIEQTSGTATIAEAAYYNLNLHGTSTYDLSNLSEINNDFLVQNAALIQNNTELAINNIFTYSSSRTSTLTDNITTGSLVLNSGTLNDGGRRITIVGSGWTRNGGTFTSTGRVAFEGESEQSIGGSVNSVFAGLEINNSSPTGVRLNRAVEISRTLTLIDGYLYTNAANILIIRDNATSTPGSRASFVAGPVRKDGNDDFVFPIGADKAPVGFGPEDRWARAGISAPAALDNSFTAEYFKEDPSAMYNTTRMSGNLRTVSRLEFWMINRVSGASAINVSLYFENAVEQGISDCSSMRVSRWDGNEWEEKLAVTSGLCYGSVSGSVTTTTPFVNFSPFTFASTEFQNVLPIQLLSFDAKYSQEKAVQLNWVTAKEINNEYFEIERSKDGVQFEFVTKIKGAINSSVKKTYSTNDFNPLPGLSYYRLKQVDTNGEYSYSQIVGVKSTASAVAIEFYPNPVPRGQQLNIDLNGENIGEGDLKILLMDIQGRILKSEMVKSNQLKDVIIIDIPDNIVPGTYVIKGVNTKEAFKSKIIVK